MKINNNFNNLSESYLFVNINKKVSNYISNNPDKHIIKLGIGDVTRQLAPIIVNAMKAAVDEMGTLEGFRGYGPERGYEFLRKAVLGFYNSKNINLELDDIFISDGAKSDISNMLDIFDKDNTVLIPDPVYPVYVDSNIMAGRKIIYIKGSESNNFLPMPQEKADIAYICSPNNPTGAVYSHEQLKTWVDWAIEYNAIIFYDAAYEIFIQDKIIPTSIYKIPRARECAIEFGTLSKTAGFTGVRCGYTIVPNNLNSLWLRRQGTKFNGVPYIVQKGAEAVFTEEGQKEIKINIDYYLENAKILSDMLYRLNIWHTGGEHSPYIWLKCPDGKTSWEYFDYLLEHKQIVGVPGAGFGEMGEGYFRLSAFGSREDVLEAVKRLEEKYE